MKFVFFPYLPHLSLLYKGLRSNADTFFLADKSALPYLLKEDKETTLFTPVHFFNLERLRYWVNVQTTFPLIIKNFSQIIDNNGFDTLVCFDFYHWYTLQTLRYKKNHPEVKLIIYSETKRWPKSKLSQLIMRAFLARVHKNQTLINHVLVYTEEGKQWWHEQVPRLPVTVLPAPVDTEKFKLAPNKEWLPKATLRILMNARYSPYKRHGDLFRAIEILRRQGRQVAVTLIGRDDDGRARVEQQVKEYHLEELVNFLDPLPMEKMSELYYSHDILVLPSYNEAIGMVVPEAMACGLPTITSDTVGANVYVRHGRTGYIFETGSVNQLVSHLNRCYDREHLQELSKEAAKHINSNFTPVQMAQKFLDALA